MDMLTRYRKKTSFNFFEDFATILKAFTPLVKTIMATITIELNTSRSSSIFERSQGYLKI